MAYKPAVGQHLTGYQVDIVWDTGCDPADAAEIEELMRDAVFHSTLDWQTDAQFKQGAIQAYELLKFQRTHCMNDKHDEPCPLPCIACAADKC